jgi:hypothetical protein
MGYFPWNRGGSVMTLRSSPTLAYGLVWSSGQDYHHGQGWGLTARSEANAPGFLVRCPTLPWSFGQVR